MYFPIGTYSHTMQRNHSTLYKNYKTLYFTNISIMCYNISTRLPSPPNRGKTPWLWVSVPWQLPPTDITGGEPVRHYTCTHSHAITPESTVPIMGSWDQVPSPALQVFRVFSWCNLFDVSSACALTGISFKTTSSSSIILIDPVYPRVSVQKGGCKTCIIKQVYNKNNLPE